MSTVCCRCSNKFPSMFVARYLDNQYCPNCIREKYACSTEILCHGYKPAPVFYGQPPYFGVELEIDGGGENEYNAYDLIEKGEFRHLYIKEDCSLDDGIEIVSHPCQFEYHTDIFPWKKVIEKAKKLGYRSHNPGTCGLHIHIDRQAFGSSEPEQEFGIMKLLYIVEKHWDKVLKFSRRTRAQADRWASRYGIEDPKELLDKAKEDAERGSRYRAINLEPEETIEVRIFRGTLNYNTFIATIQFTKVLVDLVNELEVSNITSIKWGDIVERGRQYKELTEYFKQRDLNVTEESVGA